jgi:hypothetical protein
MVEKYALESDISLANRSILSLLVSRPLLIAFPLNLILRSIDEAYRDAIRNILYKRWPKK